jgi:hypothetical protein
MLTRNNHVSEMLRRWGGSSDIISDEKARVSATAKVPSLG